MNFKKLFPSLGIKVTNVVLFISNSLKNTIFVKEAQLLIYLTKGPLSVLRQISSSHTCLERTFDFEKLTEDFDKIPHIF